MKLLQRRKTKPRPARQKAESGLGGMHVLFLGNSLTYSNDLPLMVQALAKAAGQSLHVEEVSFGGYDLEDHWHSGSTVSALAGGNWDVVVLQQGPSSLRESGIKLRTWTRKWAPRIREAGAEPALFMVWPEADRMAWFDAVRDHYSQAAEDVEGIFLPAGEAWRAALRRDPGAPLYSYDDFHPSAIGTYTAALSIYGMLFKRDPRGLPARLELSNGYVVQVPEDLAEILQEAAAEANEAYGRS